MAPSAMSGVLIAPSAISPLVMALAAMSIVPIAPLTISLPPIDSSRILEASMLLGANWSAPMASLATSKLVIDPVAMSTV